MVNKNKLYRIEVIAHNNLPEIDTMGMLTTNEGIAYVKLHPVRIKATQWIPASQPPKKYGKYQVACENTETAQIRLYDGEWDSIAKVTHWMPLPEPPKEG